MRRTVLASTFCLAALLAAPASAALSDFRLPVDPPPQSEPERVGPVAPDVPESRRPAPTPTPRQQTSQTTTEQPQIEVPDLPAATPRPSPTQVPTPARTRAAPAVTTPVQTAEPAASDSPAPEAAFPGLPQDTTAPSPVPTAPIAAPPDEDGTWWPWALAALAAIGAMGLARWAWQRRGPAVRPSAVPHVERPRLDQHTPPVSDVPAEPLQITLDPLRLSLTLMNATLAYRLEVANRGAAAIVGLAIGADMIAAHASMTREEQLSGPGEGAATVQRIDRLEPGESRIVEGEFRVPFSRIVPIRQGNAALLLPLARFRLVAEGAAPVVRTFAVGQPGAQSALQPFRLDQGPRVYPRLTQRAFA